MSESMNLWSYRETIHLAVPMNSAGIDIRRRGFTGGSGVGVDFHWEADG